VCRRGQLNGSAVPANVRIGLVRMSVLQRLRSFEAPNSTPGAAVQREGERTPKAVLSNGRLKLIGQPRARGWFAC
jgi:hypothetical protein